MNADAEQPLREAVLEEAFGGNITMRGNLR